MSSSYDAIVIGGGIIGCSIAWRLAQTKRRVALVERGRVGGEASSAAAGILIPEASPTLSSDLFQLYLASHRLYPAFVQEVREATGEAFEFNVSGRLVTGFTDDDVAELHLRFERQGPAGIRADWLTAADVRAAEPSISPSVQAALYFPDHSFVDNARLTHAIGSAARRAGVELFENRLVASLRLEGDRVTGVETLMGGLASPIVVNCAGSWAGLIDPRAWKPVRPFKGEMLAVDRGVMPLFHMIQGPNGSATPRADGRTQIGATRHDVGFDKDVQVKAIANLFRGMTQVLPGLEEARFLDAWAGLRPACPDNLPIIGQDERIRGLSWATGHFGMGILSAPATAQAITELIETGGTRMSIEQFSPARFGAAELANV